MEIRENGTKMGRGDRIVLRSNPTKLKDYDTPVSSCPPGLQPVDWWIVRSEYILLFFEFVFVAVWYKVLLNPFRLAVWNS